MHWIDWLIVIIPLLVVIFIGLKTQKYVKGVSDFLTAGRVAGRYIVAVANGEAAMGLISLVALFEMYYKCGFAVSFWSQINIPISIVLTLSGYCIYRFRETRAMTLGQFFEMRYSKSFRIFAAILQSISGVVNYAIFPAVGARFLIYFCDLPLTVNIFGLVFPTFALVMMAFLSLAVIIIMFGGQITIMVTDCIQGILSYPMYVIVVAFILYKFSWFNEMVPTLLDRAPGTSMLNPYDVSKLRDFNLFYVFVGIFGGIMNRMAWSGTQGYNAAAADPHEQKMGAVLGAWRSGFSVMMYILLAIAAYTFLHNASFNQGATKVRQELTVKALADVAPEQEFTDIRNEIKELTVSGKISPALQAKLDTVEDNTSQKAQPATAAAATTVKAEDMVSIAQDALKTKDKGKAQTYKTIYGQMLVPLSIRHFLPLGITGVFCALMIFLLISTDTTYMHSWGSIIVQDIILPFRKTPFKPKQQLLLLRLIIAGVAVVAFLFSFFFGQVDYILMFFVITGAIWLGGAGPCIIFGLYWKRGTTWGAFAALISGSILAVSGFLAQSFWVAHIYPWLVKVEMIDSVKWFVEGISAPLNPYVVWTVTADKFPINSQEIYFIAMLVALFLYISLSLLTCKTPFNMERLLHRGKYHKEGKALEKAPKITIYNAIPRLVGINSQYSKWDKALAWSVFIYSMGYHFGAFLIIIIWNYFSPWPVEWWANWFLFNSLILVGIIGAISTVWFTIGGTWDLHRMFKRLAAKETNLHDDGRVIGHVSAEDLETINRIDEGSLPETLEREEEHSIESHP
jgi:Na+/proline symporter